MLLVQINYQLKDKDLGFGFNFLPINYSET